MSTVVNNVAEARDTATAEPLCLRPPGRGLIEMPVLAVLLAPDREPESVPVAEREELPDGTTLVRGESARWRVEARIAPATPRPVRHDVTLTVTCLADRAVDAGVRVEVLLGPCDDPGWLVPGAFYGENRSVTCQRIFPRYQATDPDPDPAAMVSDHWAFRADRCATPAVFARDGVGGAALVTSERCEAGLSGVGFALVDGRPALRLHFPYREEPISYYGTSNPLPAEAATCRWRPAQARTSRFSLYPLDADPHAYAAVLRDVHGAEAAGRVPAAWVDIDEAARLAAWGLFRWHYRADPPVLLETAAFDREALGERGDRPAMHVSWVSGVPYAYALLRHARRVGDHEYAAAALAVLDHIADNLTPAGTFWGQWSAGRGWTVGWTEDRHRLHARTLADATLFLLRALVEERARGEAHPSWERAIRGSLAVARSARDAAGDLGSAYHSDDGSVISRDGTAGLAWIAPLVEAARALEAPEFLDVARAAGARYAADVRAEFLCGAPEDVDLAPTSEDGYGAVMGYVALAESERRGSVEEARWIDLARRSAEWTLTFRYSYDVAFSDRTMLGRYGFRSRGADQASPANQHLHAFGLVCLPELVRLALRTGDDYLLRSAWENLDCFRQFVAREDGDFDAYRGMVTERLYQTSCFQAKGMVLTLSHAWSVGLLLYACEAAREFASVGLDLEHLDSTKAAP